MKKYLLGMTAIVLAIGFSAFTKPVGKPATNSFLYALRSGVSPTTAAIVQDIDNWKLVPSSDDQSLTVDCSTPITEYEPCQILVDKDFSHSVTRGGDTYQAPGSTGHTVAIAAASNVSGHFFVNTVSTPSGANISSDKMNKDQ